MRKKILITETSTKEHEIIVDCFNEKAEQELENVLDNTIGCCSDFREIEDVLDIDGIDVVSSRKDIFLFDNAEFTYELEDV